MLQILAFYFYLKFNETNKDSSFSKLKFSLLPLSPSDVNRNKPGN